jgi:hypothetical protein
LTPVRAPSRLNSEISSLWKNRSAFGNPDLTIFAVGSIAKELSTLR